MTEPTLNGRLAVDEPPRDARPRSRLRRLLRALLRLLSVGLLMAAVLYLSHSWWLRWTAEALVVNEPFETAALAFPLDGPETFDVVSELIRTGRAAAAGLRREAPSRLVERGILPDVWRRSNSELDARGISAAARSTLPGVCDGFDDFGKEISRWLREHPGETVVLVCERYRGRWTRRQLDSLLPSSEAQRIVVAAAPNPSVPADNWWRTRDGRRVVATEWVRLVSTWLAGREGSGARRTSADFQRAAVQP